MCEFSVGYKYTVQAVDLSLFDRQVRKASATAHTCTQPTYLMGIIHKYTYIYSISQKHDGYD